MPTQTRRNIKRIRGGSYVRWGIQTITHLVSSLSSFFRTIAKRAILPTFVFGLVSLLSSLTRGAKVRRQLSALHIFSINSQPPLFQPPRMVIFHFTKVTRSENCGQLGRPALNWGRRLPAVSETPHKDTDRLFAKHPAFGFAQFFNPIFFRCNFPFFETGGVFFDSLVVSLDVKKSVAFLGKRCRQQWPIRMQIYAGYNFLETLSIHTLENTRKSEETQL